MFLGVTVEISRPFDNENDLRLGSVTWPWDFKIRMIFMCKKFGEECIIMTLHIRERSLFTDGGGVGANPKMARTQNLSPLDNRALRFYRPSKAMH